MASRLPRGRGLRAMAGLAAAAALLSACAGIPSSGPVRQGAEVGSERNEPFIQLIAREPVAGLTEQQVLDGFLQASASFDNDHAVARDYLAPEVRHTWRPGVGVVVYDDSSGNRALLDQQGSVITLRATEVARISEQGEYAASPGGTVATAKFTLRKVGGEWRIASLPDGLFLTQLDVARAYRSFDLYFPDPTKTVLVPNPVLLPVGSGVSTSLVHALLEGPSAWLAPAVATAFPVGTTLVGSAPVRNNVVEVDLSSEAARAGSEDMKAMSAQLVWTLRQLSDVAAVQISVDGVPLNVPGASPAQPRDAWPSFDPDALRSSALGYFVRDGRVYSFGSGDPSAVPGPFGDGQVVVRSPAVSLEGDLLAGLDASGRLVVGRLASGEKAAVLLTGTSLSAPSWDIFGNAWVVDRTKAGPVVWTVRPGEKPRRVTTVGLPPGQILALSVARDGARAAVVIKGVDGGRLYVGRMERAENGITLAGLRPVESSYNDVLDVSWNTADRLVVLGVGPAGITQPSIVDLSGVVLRDLGSVGKNITSVAGAPGRPVLAATVNGKVFQYSDLNWTELGPGVDPAYPG